MKKVVFGIFVLIFAFGFFWFQEKAPKTKVLPASDVITPEILRSAQNDTFRVRDDTERKLLFVPYWGMTAQRIPDSFGDKLVYFGIAPGREGIDKTEPGYVGLARFEAISQGRETFLVLRMIDQDMSFSILKDQKLQEKIIVGSIETAKQYKFKGIVLDLEISSLPFVSITDQMNKFVEDFSKAAKKANLSFSMMFFGDTFYRLRSYDVLALTKHINQALVMAYDFHKAKGDPGPNFPLHGKETYRYDFTVMVNDFLNIVPKEKLTVVFGMFGYDWTVDENGKSTHSTGSGQGQASSMSLYQIKEKFLTNCQLKNCVVKRDETSEETKVTYVDADGNNHIVWFEDEESVAKKSEFLKEKGINEIGFWAYSYF